MRSPSSSVIVLGIAVLIVSSALPVGCAPRQAVGQQEYQTVAADPRRDTQTARQHNAAAVERIRAGDLDAAEAELKAALAADMFYGPAHNNLGIVHDRRKEYYLAAWEFQYAVRLMPNRAEPRSNLGEVFETVGKLEDAEKMYEEALKIEPDRPEVIGNLARLHVRTDRNDERTRQLLSEVVTKDTRPQWTSWARERLAVMGGAPQQPPATEPADAETLED